MSPRIAIVVGTRPEIIKLAGVTGRLGSSVDLIHTGQHWDHDMSGQFWEGLSLPSPQHRLDIGGRTRAAQLASCLGQLGEIWSSAPPDVVVVHGDTNTTLGGALAANSVGIPLVHIEAGLRSHDRTMPEEHNRVLVDHLADLCLAPTHTSADNLSAENIDRDRIRVTGNTVIDAVHRVIEDNRPRALPALGDTVLDHGDFIVATVHRPENTDDPHQLTAVLQMLGRLAAMTQVVVPLHPRTADRIAAFSLEHLLDPLVTLAPLGYEDFIRLCAKAGVIVSDSGGVQEEASVLARPVVVLRRSTERPEGIGTFTTLCTNVSDALTVTSDLWSRRHAVHATLESLPSPFGDRTAPERCVQEIERLLVSLPKG